MSTRDTDRRHHVRSMLMRESLLDKQVMASTESPVVRMLPDVHVVKVGGRSIIDVGAYDFVIEPYFADGGAWIAYVEANEIHVVKLDGTEDTVVYTTGAATPQLVILDGA